MKISELTFGRNTIQVTCSCGAVWNRTGLIAPETVDDWKAWKRFVKEHGDHKVAGLKCISKLEKVEAK